MEGEWKRGCGRKDEEEVPARILSEERFKRGGGGKDDPSDASRYDKRGEVGGAEDGEETCEGGLRG